LVRRLPRSSTLSPFLTASPPPLPPTLSLHDALPICCRRRITRPHREYPGRSDARHSSTKSIDIVGRCCARTSANRCNSAWHSIRSEEHTSELQSRGHLVCRLLLEKKKKQ